MDDQRWPRLTLNLRNALRALHDRAERNRQGLFLAEGANLANAALVPSIVIIRTDATEADTQTAMNLAGRGSEVYQCSVRDMEVLAETKTPQSLLCVVPYVAERAVGDRVVVLDGVSDPGNVGTIIRTAAWFGWTDVILGRGCADLYNPKVVRSTAGALGSINVLRSRDLVDVLPQMLSHHQRIAAVPRGGQTPADILGNGQPVAVIIGSEAHGISTAVLEQCTMHVTIPGMGSVESLNAAIASAILCYEGRRLPA